MATWRMWTKEHHVRQLALSSADVKLLFVNGAFDLGRLASLAASTDFTLEVVRKLTDQKEFQIPPRRWVVERTFGWMMRWRRLMRDYAVRLDVSDAMIYLSMGALLFRHAAHPGP